MTDAKSLTLTAKESIEFMDTEVDINAECWQFNKNRIIAAHKSSEICIDLSLGLNVSFKKLCNGRKTLNEAEIFLLPEEQLKFTLALIQHPIVFPSNYSQHLSMEQGMYCIRLKSQEPFEDFAGRLSAALDGLK